MGSPISNSNSSECLAINLYNALCVASSSSKWVNDPLLEPFTEPGIRLSVMRSNKEQVLRIFTLKLKTIYCYKLRNKVAFVPSGE